MKPEKPPRHGIPFDIGDRVTIDGDGSITAVVTALTWRATYPEVEVSWVHNGDLKTAWRSPDRLGKS